MRSAAALLALCSLALLSTGTAHEARACGGSFPPPPPPNQDGEVVTDHRMIFRVTPQATTLYDEIEYTGSPQSFAWVLPIQGPVTIALSSDIVFSALDALTAPTLIAPPFPSCPECNCCPESAGSSSGSSSGGGSGGGGAPPVTVTSQQTVGPYATVQLQSSDPTALDTWLTANGYPVPAAIEPVIAAYVQQGFDFLAMKLVPGQGIAAMRPVRVTSAGAGLTLPLRMVAAGAGSTVGITLFVVGDGRYAPQNFQTFTISGADLTWDWLKQTSNYTTVQAQKEAALGGAAWQIESAQLLEARDSEAPILNDQASADYLPVLAAADAGTTDAGATDAGSGTGETADQVRQDDLATLFPGGNMSDVFVTRMRANLSQAALGSDLMLEASRDQSVLSTEYYVSNSINGPVCGPPCGPCDPNACGGGEDDGGSNSSSGGGGGNSSGGGAGNAAQGGHANGSGCSTAMSDRVSDNGILILAGLAIAAVAVNRGRRRGAAR
jgi:hypothetical protein